MRRSASSVAGASGTLASLGDSVKWDVVGIGDGQHVIRAKGSKTSYLAGSSQLLNSAVSMQTVSDSTVPNNCRWTVSYDNGTVFTNAATGYVLCEVNGELRAYPSSSAQNKRWRCATTIQYGDGSALSNILRELDGNFSISDMTLDINQPRSAIINKTPTSATVAWAEASDFTYTVVPSDRITVNSDGQLTANSAGNATVSATHKVTGRTATFSVVCYMPRSGYELEYQPELWNYSPVQSNTHCYFYALNTQLNPDTGRFGAVDPNGLTLDVLDTANREKFIECVQRDAANWGFTFQEVERYELCPQGTYKVAIVIARYATRRDYHWYRQNADGTWSHKQGDLPVTNLDSNNQIIYDPQTAARDIYNEGEYQGQYNVFIGYFAVTPLNYMYSANVANTLEAA